MVARELNTLIDEYQHLSKKEKVELLRLRLPRTRLLEIIQELHQPTKHRRISTKIIDFVEEKLQEGKSDPSRFFDKIEELKLSIDNWCQLRVEAEKIDLTERKKWQEAFDAASKIRSDILTQMAGLIPKIRLGSFGYRGPVSEDLDGVGYMGLIRALENFDTSKEIPFEAYARSWIYNSMLQSLRKSGLVQASEKIMRAFHAYDQKREEMESQLNRKVENFEIAEGMGMSIEDLESLLAVNTTTTSLDAEVGEGEGNSLHDILGKEEAAPYQAMEMKILAHSLQEHMSKLSNPELSVLMLRWFPLKHSLLQGRPMPIDAAIAQMQQIALQRLQAVSTTPMQVKGAQIAS